MRHQKRLAGALFCALATFAPTLRAAVVKTGGLLMQEPFGARPFALGRAYAALGDDVFGMTYNPAILSRLRESQAATQWTRSVVDTQLSYLGLASPLSPSQALGLNVSYLDGGKADIFNSNGVQTATVNAERDFLMSLGYAHSFPISSGRLHLGTSGKMLRSTLAGEASALGTAADAGSLYEFLWAGGLGSLAAAVSNLGPGIRYSGGKAGGSQSDPIPLTTRLALGYTRELLKTDRIALGVELDRVFYNDTLSEGLGLEYDYRHLCAIRLGYRWGPGNNQVTMGIGLNLRSISFDYGIGLLQSLNNVQQFSLSYHFTVPGIRYGTPLLAGPSAMESMAQRIEGMMKEGRYFDAADELERFNSIFPGTRKGPALKARIDLKIEEMMEKGRETPRYSYALAFQFHEKGAWRDAVSNLEIALLRDKDNKEIRAHVEKARHRLQEQERQMKLEAQARIGTLFEIASQAFDEGDTARALRILDEILRLGPYQPAESLRNNMARDARRRSQEAQRRPAPASTTQLTQPSSNPPQASPEDIAKAMSLYYEAVRSYAGNEIETARLQAQEGLKLDPDNTNLKNILVHIENVLRNKQQKKP